MKRIYLSIVALTFSGMLSAQNAFWTHTNYRGAFPVTDNTSATDWTSGWSNFNPENTVYGTPTTTVSTDITTNTTWSGIILLQNKVYVKNGATLTIEPGTIIRGDKASQASLIITRNSKINAAGTVTSPIIFTSNESVGNRAEGDWGGLVILGNAVNNQPGGIANIEGIAPSNDTEFGGTNDLDNSGVLKYIRIEFAGIALQPNKEINGITFGSVGKQTEVDYIQVSFSGDDSFEWFGGTVDCKHLIAYRGLDDDFDTDYGYTGRIQFGLIIRDKDLSDAAGDSNAFESDNDANGSNALPKTAAIFSNITIVGPKGNGSIALPTGEKFEKSFRIRRNSAISVFNSITVGWEKGLSIEGASTEANFTTGTSFFSNNILVGYTSGSTIVSALPSFYSSFFGVENNDSTKTVAQVDWVNLFPALGNTPDARLKSGSIAAGGASFNNAIFGGEFVSTKIQDPFIDFNVYPNPAKTEFTIQFELASASQTTIQIYDLRGTLILDEKHNNLQVGNHKIHVNTSTLSSGIYQAKIQTAGTTKSFRISIL
ncbi:MAG: T9SS type A sorting domain-containing protein [Crocinitomicaceae bacterium]|nr:T9SS type A sorting domain-containing protein [Crocinitomicaceae bacterium]